MLTFNIWNYQKIQYNWHRFWIYSTGFSSGELLSEATPQHQSQEAILHELPWDERPMASPNFQYTETMTWKSNENPFKQSSPYVLVAYSMLQSWQKSIRQMSQRQSQVPLRLKWHESAKNPIPVAHPDLSDRVRGNLVTISKSYNVIMSVQVG